MLVWLLLALWIITSIAVLKLYAVVVLMVLGIPALVANMVREDKFERTVLPVAVMAMMVVVVMYDADNRFSIETQRGERFFALTFPFVLGGAVVRLFFGRSK